MMPLMLHNATPWGALAPLNIWRLPMKIFALIDTVKHTVEFSTSLTKYEIALVREALRHQEQRNALLPNHVTHGENYVK